MKKGILTFVSLFVAAYLLPVSVFAHGSATSIQKDSGAYSVEFEYDGYEVISGETMSYAFRLLDKGSKNDAPFDTILLRYENKADNTTFAVVRLAQDELQKGIGRFTVNLPQGDFLVTLKFYSGEEKIAEADFDLQVIAAQSSVSQYSVYVLPFVVGIVLGLLAAKYAKPKNAKNNKELITDKKD